MESILGLNVLKLRDGNAVRFFDNKWVNRKGFEIWRAYQGVSNEGYK